MSDSEGEELSVATVEDLQGVLDMCGDVYNGIDYLPYAFPRLVDGPGVRAFVYKHHCEMVSHRMVRVAGVPKVERENSNSKTLIYKDCSLRSVKNLSNN